MESNGKLNKGTTAKRTGPRVALKVAPVRELRLIVAQHKHASLNEVTCGLGRRLGSEVCTAMVHKALNVAGATRVRSASVVLHSV